jgi:hypothetical protein
MASGGRLTYSQLFLCVINLFFLLVQWGKQNKKTKNNYLLNHVPLASASRSRIMPAGGVVKMESASLFRALSLASKSAHALPSPQGVGNLDPPVPS